ncbi:MAG TPA: hypothetical protein VEC92_03500 [Nitrososphaerales archaeon]|nr:hypothetical protein [Nitrososphaerales archaeon]
MAGFLDGEGLVTIVRQVRKDRPSPAYRAYVTISNTKRSALEVFPTFYGGKIYCTSEQRSDWYGRKWADAFAWYCPISSTKSFLTGLLPYMKLKDRQAKLVIDFIENKKAFARGRRLRRGGSSPLTQEEIDFRERLRAEVRLLNSKGKFARSHGGGLKRSSKFTSMA